MPRGHSGPLGIVYISGGDRKAKAIEKTRYVVNDHEHPSTGILCFSNL